MTAAMYNHRGMKLVPFTKDDLTERYQSWFHSPDVTRYNSHGLFPYTKERMEEFVSSLGRTEIIIWKMMTEKLGHIGNISLQSINWIYRSAEFAIIIGERKAWGKGWGAKAGELVLYHGFCRLNLNRIWTGTASSNMAMCKLAEHLGMTSEGFFKEGMFLNGKYTDIESFAILRSEYNPLRGMTDDES